ncbi:hypothetical protein TNCT_118841 [Trichonephila clavata]|uniref:Uncharacterized protein n=1 Tax=Trichonephila clavata TaxID=2740835 RepID=A0A8X6H7Q3_TRICU|nr:hypothetical protein TNCT_118841 [Trichonephila clavata]
MNTDKIFFKSIPIMNILKLPPSCSIIFRILELLCYLLTKIVLSLSVIYYGITCRFIRYLYQRLLEQLNRSSWPEDKLLNLLSVYGDIMKSMEKLNDDFSFSAFITVLMSMIGLFWSGYRVAFRTNMSEMHFHFLISSIIFYLSNQLLIMIPAA